MFKVMFLFLVFLSLTLSSKCWLETRVSEAVKGASVTSLHKGHSLASKEH